MSWEDKELEELTLYVKRGVSPKYVLENGIPIVNQRCIRENTINFDTARLSSKDKKITEVKFLQVGDTVINSTGVGTLGRTAFVKKLDQPSSADTHVTIVRPDKTKVNPKFLSLYLNSQEDIIENMGRGATGQTELSAKDLNELKVFHPKSLQTQKRIADILSAYDDLIENNLKRIKLLEQAAQNIYKEWFVNLRFPGYENTHINEETGLPEGWEEKTISEVMEYKVDNRGKNPKYYTKSGIPVIDNHLIKNSPNIDLSKTKRYIDDELFDVFIRRYLKKDDVLITLVGTVANISLAPEEKSVIIQNTIGIRCNEFCTQEYMYCFLGANKTKIQNKNRGAAQPSVKVGDLTGMKMVIPNNELLNNFSKEIKQMFSLIQTLGKQNSQLKAARDILLPRLMNRTIEV